MNPVFRSAVTVAALWLGAALVATAADSKEFERRKAPPKRFTGVNFAEPDAAGKTNKVEDNLLPKPSLGTIERAIRKPFEIFSPEESAGPLPQAPVRPTNPRPPTRRERERKDVRDNWVFSTPEEIFGLPTAESLLDLPEFGPNGELKKPKTSFERYLERKELERQAGSTNQAAAGVLPDWARPDEETTTETGGNENGPLADKTKPDNNRIGVYEFVNLNGAPAWGTPAPKNEGLFNFSPPAAPSLPDKTLVKDVAREQRMQEFRQILESRPAASPAPLWSVGGASPLASPATVTPAPSLSVAAPFNRGTAPPPTAGALGLSPTPASPVSPPGLITSPAPAPAPVVRPQTIPSSFTTPFDLPRRKL